MPINTIGAGLKVVITDKDGSVSTNTFDYTLADFTQITEKIAIGNLANGVCTVEVSINSMTSATPMDTEMRKVSAWLTTL